MLRLCSYNVEHFNRLFTQTNQLQGGAAEQTRLDGLRDVLQMIDADIVGLGRARQWIGVPGGDQLEGVVPVELFDEACPNRAESDDADAMGHGVSLAGERRHAPVGLSVVAGCGCAPRRRRGHRRRLLERAHRELRHQGQHSP